jgi:hypothetical protein
MDGFGRTSWAKAENNLSEDDKSLCALFDRMLPSLKKRILRHAEKEPDLMNLDIVLLSSILQIRKELNCENIGAC